MNKRATYPTVPLEENRSEEQVSSYAELKMHPSKKMNNNAGGRAQVRIGVLDDNIPILEYLKAMLELVGYTVSLHPASRSLLDALLPGGIVATPLPYDLVILDLSLPGDLSGAEVYHAIRRSIPGERLPVLFVTAASDRDIQDLQATFREDALLLHKPFRQQELLSKISELLNNRHCSNPT
jgi:DNA-binding response OmpR family regulator